MNQPEENKVSETTTQPPQDAALEEPVPLQKEVSNASSISHDEPAPLERIISAVSNVSNSSDIKHGVVSIHAYEKEDRHYNKKKPWEKKVNRKKEKKSFKKSLREDVKYDRRDDIKSELRRTMQGGRQEAMDRVQKTADQRNQIITNPAGRTRVKRTKSIFLKNLFFFDKIAVNDWLIKTFEVYGDIAHTNIFEFKPARFSAVVNFYTQEDADAAYEHFSKKPTVFANGQTAFINWHEEKAGRTSNTRKVYIKNLKLDTNPKDLMAVLSTVGKVESVALDEWESKDKTRKAKYGFIRFANPRDAGNVLRNPPAELQNFAVPEAPVQLDRYQSKEERNRYIANLRQQRWEEYLNSQRMGNPKHANRVANIPVPVMARQRSLPRQYNPVPVQPVNLPQIQLQSTFVISDVLILRSHLNEFLGFSQEKQRQILGQLLYPLVKQRTTDFLAPKVTGMLIDLSVLEVSEIIEFLEDSVLLDERVAEAIELLCNP